MAISDEISRLQSAKSALKTSIEGKGVTVSSSAKLEDYPALVDSIQAGGGSSDDYEYLSFEDLIFIDSTHAVPLMEKNLLIRQSNEWGREDATVTYKNSSTGKKFTYTTPSGYSYYFLCPKNSSSVTVLTKKSTISIT